MLITLLITLSIARATTSELVPTPSGAAACAGSLTRVRSAATGAGLLLRWLAWDHPMQLRTIARLKRRGDLAGFLSIASGWCVPHAEGKRGSHDAVEAQARALRFVVDTWWADDDDPTHFARMLLNQRAQVEGDADKTARLASAVFRSLDEIWTALAGKAVGDRLVIETSTIGEPEERCTRHLDFTTDVRLTAEDLSEIAALRDALADPHARAGAEAIYAALFEQFQKRTARLAEAFTWTICGLTYERRQSMTYDILSDRQSETSLISLIKAQLFLLPSGAGGGGDAASSTRADERREAFARDVADRFDEAPTISAETLAEVTARMHQAGNLINARLARLSPPAPVDIGAAASLTGVQDELEATSIRHDLNLSVLRGAQAEVDRLHEWHHRVADGLARLPADTPRLDGARQFSTHLGEVLAMSRAAIASRLDVEHEVAERLGHVSLAIGQHLARRTESPVDDAAVLSQVRETLRAPADRSR